MSVSLRQSAGGRPKGRLIVFEGLDGAGTTTQVARVAEALRARGHRVHATREPSEGPVGVLIRQALTGRVGLPARRGPLTGETLALLFAADRLDHLEAEVVPALARGELVVCDRYVLSSIAYQGSEFPQRWVEAINEKALSPDLTLFLEVPPKIAARRRSARGGQAELYEDDARQRAVARTYARAVKARARRDRIVRIDGTLPVNEVTRKALEAIDRLLR